MDSIKKISSLIKKFNEWYKNDAHSQNENFYQSEITGSHLTGLGKPEFVDFFISFCSEGGKVQSGGYRNKKRLKRTFQENYNGFHAFIIEPFSDDFNLDEWINRISDFNGFGPGIATIYLNRINKKKYCIINNKTVDALKTLGFSFKTNLVARYRQVEKAQKELIKEYPLLENLYKTDALNHYMIAVDEGKILVKEIFPDKDAGITVNETPEQQMKVKEIVGNLSKNIILYGPPGTGKTYNTIDQALYILGENIKQDRKILHELFEKYREEGRIGFVTFHQSFSYEDFVEGIKPLAPESSENETDQLVYDIQDGIFKMTCRRASTGGKTEKTRVYDYDESKVNFYKMSLGGKHRWHIHEWCIDNGYIALGWGQENDYSDMNNIDDWKKFRDTFKAKYPEIASSKKYTIQALFIFMNMKEGDIVLASKGNHKVEAIGKVTGNYEFMDDNPTEFCHFRKVEWLHVDLDSPVDVFVKKNLSQQSIYEFYKKDVRVEYISQLLKGDTTEPGKYVLIIDEINRGNVANIFGELITLIEEDKRTGCQEELTAILPYSKKEFSVPPNLYIIGTMNTADRSVEAIDSALRRRFAFVEKAPDPKLITQPENIDVDLQKLLITINNRIEVLLDKDHCIGHSYFMNIHKADDPLLALKEVFSNKIIPLLEEYFYGNPIKIGMVLGNLFVKKKTYDGERNISFGKGYEAALDDFERESVYKINNPMDFTESDPFKSIYE